MHLTLLFTGILTLSYVCRPPPKNYKHDHLLEYPDAVLSQDDLNNVGIPVDSAGNPLRLSDEVIQSPSNDDDFDLDVIQDVNEILGFDIDNI
jgi:hypothetical protein